MELLDLQGLFGLHVTQLYSLTPQPPTPIPPVFGLIFEGAIYLVSQDRRHLFVTSWTVLID
jgi:hypothetical protein